MADLILHPFTLRRDGSVATAPAGSDAAITSAIGVLIGTRIGERIMAWPFGVPDPAFNGLEKHDIQAGLAAFGPDGITITEVTTVPVTDEQSDVRVTWTRSEGAR